MKMPNSRGKNTGNNVAKTLKNATKNTMKSQSIHVEICAYVAIKSYGRGTQQVLAVETLLRGPNPKNFETLKVFYCFYSRPGPVLGHLGPVLYPF